MLGVLILTFGILLSGLGIHLFRRVRRWRRFAALCLCAIQFVVAGAYWTWYTLRPQPTEITEQWFKGVRYQRITRQSPAPMVAHLVRVDLREPGVSLLFTRPTEAGPFPLRATTVSRFAEAEDAQVAVNGGLFSIPRTAGPLGEYPSVGGLAQADNYAAYHGNVYQPEHKYCTVFVSQTGEVSFDEPIGPVYDAISGNYALLRGGERIPQPPGREVREPRTAIGLDKGRDTLFLLVVDGRQPGYSDGATMPELQGILLDAGAYAAMNMDGGGSSTLVRRQGTKAKLANSMSNFHIPWWERAVGMQLGVRARPLP